MSTDSTSRDSSAAAHDQAVAHLAGTGVVLRPYDPEWPRLAAEAARRILEICGSTVLSVEHIGSTAVPGLEAKPILDLLPEFARDEDGARIAPAMATLGYEYRGDYGIPGRHYYKLAATGNPHAWQHNVHAYVTGHIEWTRHILFRDALRNDDRLRDAYRDLKRSLAQAHPNNVEAYAMAKSTFVEQVISQFGGPVRDW